MGVWKVQTQYSTKNNEVIIGGRILGEIRGDVFQKTIQGSRHFLRKPPAIALDLAAIDRAEKAGAVRIRVKDSETGIVYWTTIAAMRRSGFVFDRGWGRQIALHISKFEKVQPGGGQQLSLFGGRQ